MSVQREAYYEALQLIRMLEAVINQHKVYSDKKLFHWDSVYKTAEFHRVTNMAYYAVLGMETKMPTSSREKFEKRFRQAVANEEVLQNVADAVCWKFEQSKRHILPTAGYACREYYGRKEMSECQEAEFLIERECRGLLQELMLQMNFEFQKKDKNSILYSRNGIRLIFREKWGDSSKRVQKYFKQRPVEFAVKEGFQYVHEMTAEELYLRQICDLAECFVTGYPRMRMFVNLWLFYLGNNEVLDYRAVGVGLKKLQLEEFAHRMLNLSALWFGRIQLEEEDVIGQELGLYVMSAGKEGARAVKRLLPYKCEREEKELILQRGKGAGREWRFPPREYMEALYPILGPCPFLLPIFWGIRMVRLLCYTLWGRMQGRKKQKKAAEKNETTIWENS